MAFAAGQEKLSYFKVLMATWSQECCDFFFFFTALITLIIALLSVSPISLKAPRGRSVSSLQSRLHEDRSCASPITLASSPKSGTVPLLLDQKLPKVKSHTSQQLWNPLSSRAPISSFHLPYTKDRSLLSLVP